ncbi:putative amine oxidase [copper-containing] [Stylophora pistillata]|uniref:Putative amine oxidase [copper-containing] n=1 Tax=Stylophora pistillata TaxID=50429 RepID=A0A2B4SGY7_STYPI|nr:putative amine oxidase [copper-containing] [Stylophora pistillata]
MNEGLGLDELSETSKNYLQVLAEAYDKAQGWDTRRQILSMMCGVSNYSDISRFISGLSRYRFTIANLHRLQHGSGASVTPQPSSRIRVDPKQLDHFLSYITSPHLVQDLPFGQTTLKLSSGQLAMVEVLSVIRTMIPQRIVRQYTQYYNETGFKTFSGRTMLRVLNECKVTTRKSLQGLDYFAAEGARAFDELEGLVLQLGELGLGKEWQVRYVKSLKEAKFYLKGDFRNVQQHRGAVLWNKITSRNADIVHATRKSIDPRLNGMTSSNAQPKSSSLFEDLTVSEITVVMDYLLKQAAMNLTGYSKATFYSNYIYFIQLLSPFKVDVLEYLDNNGAKPERRAVAVVFHRAADPPVVKEYIVYPVSTPTEYKVRKVQGGQKKNSSI